MLSISGIEIGGDNPCRFVAEISGNHGGDWQRLGYLVRAAKDAGADIVKFQAYRPAEIVALRGDGPAPEPWGSRGDTMASLYEKNQTPLEWFADIPAVCEEIGIPWFSSVFGLESLRVLCEAGCPAFKVASLDRHHAWLVAAAAAMGRPVLVSTPDKDAVTFLGAPVVGLFCPKNYPTDPRDVHLTFGGSHNEWGLSSHCMHPDLPIAAIARGCKLIEMHMMLAEEPSELESNVSLTQYQFAEMISRVRAVELMLK